MCLALEQVVRLDHPEVTLLFNGFYDNSTQLIEMRPVAMTLQTDIMAHLHGLKKQSPVCNPVFQVP